MAGRQHTIDTDELVENGLNALDEMRPRSYGARHTETHTCRCGAIVVVQKGHVVLEDDDKEVRCRQCDRSLGSKMYDAI